MVLTLSCLGALSPLYCIGGLQSWGSEQDEGQEGGVPTDKEERKQKDKAHPSA